MSNAEFNPDVRRPLPPKQSAHTKFVKVSSVGQLTVPAPVLRRWDMQHSGGKVVATGTYKFLLMSKQPESEQLDLNFDDTDEKTQVARQLGIYTVSTAGQVTMPAEYRQQWGLRRGGRILFVDFQDAIGFTQPETFREIGETLFPREAVLQAYLELASH